MNLKEIAGLMKLCKKFGISEIEIGDIRIVKGAETIPNPLTPLHYQTKGAAKTKEVSEIAKIQENIESREAELEATLIEDPARHEQLLIENELEGSGREGEAAQH